MRCLSLLTLAGFATANLNLKRQTKDAFQLYAYGTGIGGLSVFSTGNTTYLGSFSALGDSNAAPVIFAANTLGVWEASPNTTGLETTPNWTNKTFAVPAATASSHSVKLLPANNTASAMVTTGFYFYGHVAILEATDGTWLTDWYATPTTIDGIYTLDWNNTESTDSTVLVTLKDTEPSTS